MQYQGGGGAGGRGRGGSQLNRYEGGPGNIFDSWTWNSSQQYQSRNQCSYNILKLSFFGGNKYNEE